MAKKAEKLAAKPDKPLARQIAKLASRHLDKIVEIAGCGELEQAENIHDMRVATRRFREVVKIQRDAGESRKLKRLQHFARDLGKLLGTIRGLDVMRHGLGELGEAKAFRPIQIAIEIRRGQEANKLAGLVESDKFRDWADQTEATFRKSEKGGPTAHEAMARLVQPAVQRVEAFKDAKPDDDFAKLHALRIAVKHARYRLEFFNFAPLQEFDHAIELLTTLQDRLGAIHDDILLRDELQEAIESGSQWHKPEKEAIRDAIRGLESRIRQGRKDAEAVWKPVFELAART